MKKINKKQLFRTIAVNGANFFRMAGYVIGGAGIFIITISIAELGINLAYVAFIKNTYSNLVDFENIILKICGGSLTIGIGGIFYNIGEYIIKNINGIEK